MKAMDAAASARWLLGKRAELAAHLPALRARCATLRAEIGRELPVALGEFALCEGAMEPLLLDAIALNVSPPRRIIAGEQRIGTADVPTFVIDDAQLRSARGYGTAQTTVKLDSAIGALNRLLPVLVELAEKHKARELILAKMDSYARRAHALEQIGTASAHLRKGE